MRKLTLLATGLIVLCAGSLSAAPIFPATQCAAAPGAIIIPPTADKDILFLQSAWTAAGFQCEQSDKLFSDFTTTGNTTGVTMRLILQGTEPNDVHTINFQGNLINAFTVSYTVTVDPMSIERTRRASLDLQNPSETGNPSVTKTVVELSPGVFTGSTTASFLGGPATPITITPHAESLRVTDAYSPNGGSSTGFGNGFTQTAVPEPGTTALLGAGLLLSASSAVDA